jgi:hypothetical protein
MLPDGGTTYLQLSAQDRAGNPLALLCPQRSQKQGGGAGKGRAVHCCRLLFLNIGGYPNVFIVHVRMSANSRLFSYFALPAPGMAIG